MKVSIIRIMLHCLCRALREHAKKVMALEAERLNPKPKPKATPNLQAPLPMQEYKAGPSNSRPRFVLVARLALCFSFWAGENVAHKVFLFLNFGKLWSGKMLKQIHQPSSNRGRFFSSWQARLHAPVVSHVSHVMPSSWPALKNYGR